MTYLQQKQYGHIIKDIGDYWLEVKTGNKLSKSIRSDIDYVPTYFKDNMSCCTNCVDCYECTSCNHCLKCKGCVDCVDCVDCKKCYKCINCKNLNNKKDKKRLES